MAKQRVKHFEAGGAAYGDVTLDNGETVNTDETPNDDLGPAPELTPEEQAEIDRRDQEILDAIENGESPQDPYTLEDGSPIVDPLTLTPEAQAAQNAGIKKMLMENGMTDAAAEQIVSSPGFFSKLASKFKTADGSIDWGKVIKAAVAVGGGIAAINTNNSAGGQGTGAYQGGIPSLTASRTMNPVPTDRRPGAGGVTHFTPMEYKGNRNMAPGPGGGTAPSVTTAPVTPVRPTTTPGGITGGTGGNTGGGGGGNTTTPGGIADGVPAPVSDKTAEQLASIKDMWAKIGGNPKAVLQAMTTYGVSAQDLAKATGQSMQQVGGYLQNSGAASGFGGYHYNLTDGKPSTAADIASGNYSNLGLGSAYTDWANRPAPTTYAEYLAREKEPVTDPTVNLLKGSTKPYTEQEWNAVQARIADEKRRGVTFGGGASPSQTTGRASPRQTTGREPGVRDNRAIGSDNTDPAIAKIKADMAGLRTQADLQKYFATSGYSPKQFAAAAPQFGNVADYANAMNKGTAAYNALPENAQAITKIKADMAGLKTQDDLNRYFATSGFNASQFAAAAPQFGTVADYQRAVTAGTSAYNGQRVTTHPAPAGINTLPATNAPATDPAVAQIKMDLAGLRTQADLNKYFATSGYNASQLAAAAPQFGTAADYTTAMAQGTAAYNGQQGSAQPAVESNYNPGWIPTEDQYAANATAAQNMGVTAGGGAPDANAILANRPDVAAAWQAQGGAGSQEDFANQWWNDYGSKGMAAGGGVRGGIAALRPQKGRFLRGPGDGVSDSIPAKINGRQPAALADGEFVIPARIVSELGNGSSEAGSRKLYAMLDRIEKSRHSNKVTAKNTNAAKHLPA